MANGGTIYTQPVRVLKRKKGLLCVSTAESTHRHIQDERNEGFYSAYLGMEAYRNPSNGRHTQISLTNNNNSCSRNSRLKR